MQIKVRSWRRLNAGILFIAFGLAGAHFASPLQLGTASSMGPGFMPTICSWLIVVLGLVVATQAFFGDLEVVEPVMPRPVLVICLSIALFALLIQRAGMGMAVFVTAFVASYAGQARFVETLILSLCAAIGTVIVFVFLLGLTIPVWPELQ